ncbi:ABC transporter permease subunit [Methylomicrobium agile]|uniref:ABC transporter permease subunit n=1 Tax=Methylomicrobium agile TaxID=39774 RepID=UPI0004DF0E2D|nr:ABC transporter permease subunit [Methylomicrobium agile]
MKKLIPFSLILLTAAVLLAGCKKSETLIHSLEDARRAKIGVMTGSTGEAITLARFPEAQVKSFDDIMDAVAAMKSGQLDAIVTAFPAALQVSKKNRELDLLPETLAYEDTAIAVRKGNRELREAVNRIIAGLKGDGTLAAMKQRWFKPELTPYEELNLTLPKEGAPLKIGVSATREPFSFVDRNGRVTGHDGELARMIAVKLQRPVEFFNMKFMALIPALQSGKVDLIVTGMTATEERKKFVDFTQSYYANAQVMLVRKSADAAPAPAAATVDGNSDETSALAHLDGRRIGVLGGSAGDLAARKHFPNAAFQVFTASADAALAVKSRKTDAFVYDKSVLLNLVERNPELVILEQPVDKLEVAAALKKGKGTLLADIDSALSELKREGTLQRLRAKWIDSKYQVAPPIAPTDSPSDKGVLRMGTCATIEPFSFLANGKPTGLDIELGRLIGARLGKKIEIVDMNFEALIPALQAGKIDFALSNFNVTDERKQLIDFSLPYVENDISALVRRVSPGGRQTGGWLVSVADLKNKRIGVLMGSAHDTYATKNYPDAAIFQYKSPADVALAVKTGKVDAALFDAEPLREILRRDGSFGLLGDPLFSFSVGAGFDKNNQALKNRFTPFLAEIRKNGVYADMIRRWMEQGDTRMPVIANAGANGTMAVGVSDAGLPFTAVQDNRLVGFDIELAERFAAYLGKNARFANMEFGSLIAAASTGKVDMIASAIYVTEERKKQIDFSEPYFEMGTRVFALKKNIAASGAPPEAETRPTSFLSRAADSFYSNILQENRYLLIWDGLKTTVIISIFSTLFGTLLGALICFMRMSRRPLLRLPAKLYITLLRGTPVLVLLMLIFYVVFASVDISPLLVAIIAFGMNFAAYVSEIFRTGIEGVDKGQAEAGIAMGFTKLETFLFIVLPQTVQRILPVYKGEFLSLVKMTSIVGYIAVQDLTKASDIIRSRTFDAFFPLIMVAILYFTIAWILMQSLDYLERITDPKYRRRRPEGKA